MITFHKNNLLIVLLIALYSTSTFAQTYRKIDLTDVLKKADDQAVFYQNEFKDLVAKETKTFDHFNVEGVLKRRKLIESNFLVYQSKLNENVVSEFRDVIKVDGKFVGKREKSPEWFFERASRAGSIEKELQKIQRQSLRFDDTLEINGLTLFQAFVLAENIRPFFEFKISGETTIDGENVLIIEYDQTTESPSITNSVDSSNTAGLNVALELVKARKDSKIRLSGKLWLDAATFQLWGEDRKFTIQNKNSTQILTNEIRYQPSGYGFLVPKTITVNEFYPTTKSGIKPVLEISVAFEYSNFAKTKVEVKVLDDPDEN